MTSQEVLAIEGKFLGFINVYGNHFPVFEDKDKKKVIVAIDNGKNRLDLMRFSSEKTNRGSDWPRTNNVIKDDWMFLLWDGKEINLDI